MTEAMQFLEMSKFISNNSYGSTKVLSESAQLNVSDAVLGKMFELTIGKYNKIDFSEIERSRGDVTKIKYYKNLRECIDTLIDIHSVTNKVPSALIVSDALNNLVSMKSVFEYNFKIKNNAAIMIYNTIMYGIMMATSYIIAASISISKQDTTPGGAKVNVYELDSKSMSVIKSLNSFNLAVADGSLNKFIRDAEEYKTQTESVEVMEEGVVSTLLKDSKRAMKLYNALPTKAQHIGKVVANHPVKTTFAVVGILAAINIIPIFREIIYGIYRCRQSISDAAALQARFMELNIESLEQMDPNAVVGRTRFRHKPITSEQLITKQTKWVDRFNSISQKFALDTDKAERDAKIDMKNDRVDVSNIVL